MPLASVAAAGCKHIPRVWVQVKRRATYVLYHFCDGLKFQNRFFGSHKASNTWIWILCPLWLRTLTLPTHRYHKIHGVYDVIGELFAIDCQDLSQVSHICWCHSVNLYGFWPCHVRHACDIGWCQLLPLLVYGGPFHHFLLYQQLIWSNVRHCEVADCLGSNSAMRNYVVQLGVFWFA
jgi:hypothetical protein